MDAVSHTAVYQGSGLTVGVVFMDFTLRCTKSGQHVRRASQYGIDRRD
jgi:hypothetical protein